MALQVITMYADFEGGAEAAEVSVDVPGNGHITGVDWSLREDLDADADNAVVGLSFASSSDLIMNDTRSLISTIAAGNGAGAIAAGYAVPAINKFVSFSPGIPVFAGERLYLHSNSTAGVTGDVHCHIHLDTSEGVVGSMRASSRRR